MAEGISIVDADGSLIYANPIAEKILGVKQDEIRNRTFDDPKWKNLRLDGSPLPQEEHPLAIMMANGKAVYYPEIYLQPTNGERYHISINATPIYDETGKLAGGIGTFMDVTSRRKLTLLKDEFISVASHELCKPVTSLKAALQLLNRIRGSSSNTMMPTLIDQANKSLNKVSVLIGDLLNASKINEGQLHLNKTYFYLSKLIGDSCYHIRATDDYKLKTEGDMTLKVYADADRIDQVIINFVNNAIKYAQESFEIVIRIEKLDNMAKVTVIDNGQGISSEKTPH